MRGFSLLLMTAMVGGVVPGRTFGQAATTAAKPANTAKAPAVMPTDREIAKAKAKDMVWVTKNGEVYNKDDPGYGKTKNGKFITEADAWKEASQRTKSSPDQVKQTSNKANTSELGYDKAKRSPATAGSENSLTLGQTQTPDDGQQNTHPETIKAPIVRKGKGTGTKPAVELGSPN